MVHANAWTAPTIRPQTTAIWHQLMLTDESHLRSSEAFSTRYEHPPIVVHTEEVLAYVKNGHRPQAFRSGLASLSVSRTIAPDVTYDDLSK